MCTHPVVNTAVCVPSVVNTAVCVHLLQLKIQQYVYIHAQCLEFTHVHTCTCIISYTNYKANEDAMKCRTVSKY